MKKIIRNLLFLSILGLSFYYITSCNVEKTITPLTMSEHGILRTNEMGQVLGGDYSDWCIHAPVDTFTYVVSYSVTLLNHNTVARLKWVTSKEYHNYGFDIERKKFTEMSYLRFNFIPGQGIKDDTTIYTFTDSAATNLQFYSYRLKVLDIYGNYKYYYVGPITITPPLNSSFGPAYPNPASGIFTLPFSLPRKDTVTIFFINNPDTVYLAWRKVYLAGTYKINYRYDTSVYHRVIDRIYMYCSSQMQNDSCRNFGDIQFK
jgi:hypothetical protein